MCRGSGGRCGCLWPPASFPSSQAKSRARYQKQKMCHLCCISFPFLHLFPARCASEITALRTEAGARGRQRPRQPYRCLAGRKEIGKFAEIFGQQNKHCSCQEPNRQLSPPAAICTAPHAAAFRSTVPAEPPRPCCASPAPSILSAGAPHLGCAECCWGGRSGGRDPSAAPTHRELAWHGGCCTQGAPQTLPSSPSLLCPRPAGWVPGAGRGAGGCGWGAVLVGRGGCEGKQGRGPVLFTWGKQTPVTQPAAAFLPAPGTGPAGAPRPPQSWCSPPAEAGMWGAPRSVRGHTGAGGMLWDALARRSLHAAVL